MLIVGEYLDPSTRNHLPFNESGHRVVIGRSSKQRFVPALTPLHVGRRNNRQDMLDQHLFPFDRPQRADLPGGSNSSRTCRARLGQTKGQRTQRGMWWETFDWEQSRWIVQTPRRLGDFYKNVLGPATQ